MNDLISEDAIKAIATHLHTRNNKSYNISVIGTNQNAETPHYFEIIPFENIDVSNIGFYAIDGSYNQQMFSNGLGIGIYRGGYVCFRSGKQIRMNTHDDPIILGQSYVPTNILITQDDHKYAIYDELLELSPVAKFISFLGTDSEEIFAYSRKAVIEGGISTLLGFCQEVLEWSLVYEISTRADIKKGDYILKDGTLRSLNIKQSYLIQLAEHLHDREIILLGVTKDSPVKMELNYTFRQIDNYLQDTLKPTYPFRNKQNPKLCCWFEVPDAVLIAAYGSPTGMYIRKGIQGGRGAGIFFAARLDYVEKLQNYDWLLIDVNIFDCIPNIKSSNLSRDINKLSGVFLELTRLTQEHFLLAYPYPLAEAHNFVTLRADLKDIIISQVKQALYGSQGMDHVDIENLFVDIHTQF